MAKAIEPSTDYKDIGTAANKFNNVYTTTVYGDVKNNDGTQKYNDYVGLKVVNGTLCVTYSN